MRENMNRCDAEKGVTSPCGGGPTRGFKFKFLIANNANSVHHLQGGCVLVPNRTVVKCFFNASGTVPFVSSVATYEPDASKILGEKWRQLGNLKLSVHCQAFADGMELAPENMCKRFNSRGRIREECF